MPHRTLSQFITLPELELVHVKKISKHETHLFCVKRSEFEVCPHCATPSFSTYDHRVVLVKDEPVRAVGIRLFVKKRRFSCSNCKRVFTEPLPGVAKGARTTERFKRAILWACNTFADLKAVKRAYKCSSKVLYQILYAELERKRKEQLSYAWPRILGIDEHSFKKNKRYSYTEYATVVVDYVNHRPLDLVAGKTKPELTHALSGRVGAAGVNWVVMDLCGAYRSFVRDFFPNANIIADKFHVLRLFSPVLNKLRIAVTGDKRGNPIRKLLLRSRFKLAHYEKRAIDKWLIDYPELEEAYRFKESMHAFYRMRGHNRAGRFLALITDRMAKGKTEDVKRIRETLCKWRDEILNYFKTGITNGRTEGYNGKAKLIKRRAYGYKSFENYRLRFLNACV